MGLSKEGRNFVHSAIISLSIQELLRFRSGLRIESAR